MTKYVQLGSVTAPCWPGLGQSTVSSILGRPLTLPLPSCSILLAAGSASAAVQYRSMVSQPVPELQ